MEALRLSGAKTGSEVMLAGFSLGGLEAANLAADTSFPYSVKAVVTAGSPVALMDVSSHVTLPSFEHRGDPVPRLDGAANPGTAYWTTLSAKEQVVPAPSASSPVPARYPTVCAATASRAQASGDPSVAAMETVDVFLSGAKGALQDWEVSRLEQQP
ncbi:MAG: lipase family protein [Bifidobacteriaceae bacterium]|nr:lipase family protein [Bifidobacteriaceae bacterium]